MDPQIKDKIEKQLQNSDVFLYMKGTPERPMCGFSATVVQILSEIDVPFETFDVLSDENIRRGIKEYTHWPTIPQLYLRGEFIGGHDIILQLSRSGELSEKMRRDEG